jgi:hypothetical protein
MKTLAWLGGGVPPKDEPDLVAESKTQEEEGKKTSEELWPFSTKWMKG